MYSNLNCFTGLVVSSKSTTEMNKQYETKIKALEHVC